MNEWRKVRGVVAAVLALHTASACDEREAEQARQGSATPSAVALHTPAPTGTQGAHEVTTEEPRDRAAAQPPSPAPASAEEVAAARQPEEASGKAEPSTAEAPDHVPPPASGGTARSLKATLEQVLRHFQCIQAAEPSEACDALSSHAVKVEAARMPGCQPSTWKQVMQTQLCGIWDEDETFEVQDALSRFETCAEQSSSGSWVDCKAGDERVVDVSVVLRSGSCADAWPEHGSVATQWALSGPSCVIVSGLTDGGYAIGFDVGEDGVVPSILHVQPPSE